MEIKETLFDLLGSSVIQFLASLLLAGAVLICLWVLAQGIIYLKSKTRKSRRQTESSHLINASSLLTGEDRSGKLRLSKKSLR